MNNLFHRHKVKNPKEERSELLNRPVPELSIGISTYNQVATDEVQESLAVRLQSSGCKCEACGVSITQNMAHPLSRGTDWFNVCSMCFYTENLDQVKYFDRGHIIHFPDMSQARLNCMLRAIWSIDYLDDLSDDETYHAMRDSVSELQSKIKAHVHLMSSYYKFNNPDVLVTTLDLLRPDEYKQKHKFLHSLRWLPPKELFEDEMLYWCQQNFHWLHPDKIKGNITTFVESYASNYHVKI